MKFSYQARTKEGKIQKGLIEASSRKEALNALEKYGLYVTSLNEEGKGGFLLKNISFGRVSSKDIVFFTRQFSVMLKSAIPPVEALRAQVAQVTSADFREKISKMAEVVETGGSLSQAFSLYPKIFNTFYISVVKSGEATGKVADSLDYLANHLEKDYHFKQKIRSAMIYPVFVIVVFIGSFFLVTFFIVPKISEVLTSFSGKLPLSTRGIIFLSNFVRGGGWVVILLFLGSIAFWPALLKKSKTFQNFYYKFSLKLPVFGSFFKKIYLVKFSQNLSVLISAGIPITQALKITEAIIENSEYKKIISRAQQGVTSGEKLSAILSQYPDLIPAFVLQMIITGEKTGRIEKNLMDIVGFYGQEVERTTDNLTAILEPFLLLFLGLGVAVLAISIFVPLFQMGLGGGAEGGL